MPEDVRFVVTENPDDVRIAILQNGLDAGTPSEIGPYRPYPLSVFADGEDGTMLGGVVAEVLWSWLAVRYLWVAPVARGTGLGRALLRRVEDEGRRRGCARARLDTFSFQVPEFYRRCGYQPWGELPDYPRPHRRTFFWKWIDGGDGPATLGYEPLPLGAVPVVETERLLLRPFRREDLPEITRHNADVAFTRFLTPGLGAEGSFRQLAAMLGHWQLRGYGFWAVEEKASGRYVGRIGCLQPEGWPGFEIGWALDPAVWGRGYATEGGRVALDFAWHVVGERDVISLISPDNVASIRVAEKLGALFDRPTTIHDTEVGLWRYPAPAPS